MLMHPFAFKNKKSADLFYDRRGVRDLINFI